MDMKSAVSLFKAAGDNTRLRILKLIAVRECCVCELSGITGLSNSTVSEHLKKLKECGLVAESKKSYWSYYSLNEKDKDAAIDVFLDLIESLGDPAFERDSAKLVSGSFKCSGVIMEKPPSDN